MILEETSTPPSSVFPVAALSDHLHLGTGFADDGSENSVLETCLRAAIGAIEARTGKVLLQKDFRWRLTAWREPGQQALPVAPVSEILYLNTVDAGGTVTLHDAAGWRLLEDAHRPRIVATGTCLPPILDRGSAELGFRAGMGPTWDALPEPLAQAVLLLAAEFYHRRGDTAAMGASLPRMVQSLIDPWRTVRILGERT